MTPRHVFITGASTGIGHACAIYAARAGARVFATVRTPMDADRLLAEGIVPLTVDLTDRPAIEAAAERVRQALAGRPLDALVNNAGIGLSAPVEYTAPEDLRSVFDVNVFGHVAVTQAFLPLIREARGRIVNIGSVGGHITLPFWGALCASKAAFRSLNDALRLELHPFGIAVILIEPSTIHTPAVDKTLGDPAGVVSHLPPDGAARYGDMLTEFMRRARERELDGSPPEAVARVVWRALTDPQPAARYPVGKHARLLLGLPRWLSDRVLDRVRYRLAGMPATSA